MKYEDPSPLTHWRDYQRELQRMSRRRYVRSRLPVLVLYSVSIFFVLAAIGFTGPWLYAHLSLRPSQPETTEMASGDEPSMLLRQDVAALIGPLRAGGAPDASAFTIERGGREFRVETTLDPELQSFIQGLLARSLTHQAAVVAMSPVDGRILALASYSDPGSETGGNLCLKADFPAASLFKIVAAAAAVEVRDFVPERNLTYEGRRYTLYRKQLEQVEKGRYTNEISFMRAFSSSINPVFGKIGIYHLGKDVLDRYARKFLFNEPIPLDVPLDPSHMEVLADDFSLAEIASGFNKRTVISPVHACLIAAAVANNGTMMTPWLVGRIRDSRNRSVYTADVRPLAVPITEETARIMRTLMQDTIDHGTCRSAFRTLRTRKAFQEMDMGAKTGTINDREGRYKLDWLSAYFLPHDDRPPVSLTVLAIHGEKLGIRAKNLARYIIEHWYSRLEKAGQSTAGVMDHQG